MEEEPAMLRQLIGQLQELLNFYGSPPHNVPFYLLQHNRREEQDPHRWYTPSIEEESSDECYDIMIAAENSPGCKMLEPLKLPPSKKPRKERSHGTTSNTAEPTDAMDEQIWKELPDELFEAVIARLPIASFFRFRLVCRRWNSLLESQSFFLQCMEVQQTLPWFYVITNNDTPKLYDPSVKKWYHRGIASLPEKAIMVPMASAGGLVCFLEAGHGIFYVANPLTQSVRELAGRRAKFWSRFAVGMTLNGKSGCEGYKVVRIGCDGEFEVYDSLQDAWIRPGSMPTSIKLPILLNLQSQSVSIGSKIYFMVSEPEGIVCCDTDKWLWRQYTIPSPSHVTDPILAECGGRILLVGLLAKNAATCVCVWELQRMTLLWKEVDRMPNIWCLEFYGKHVRMSCVGNKGLLLLSLSSSHLNRLVTYNMVTREWLEVPLSVLSRGRRRELVAIGITFHPSLIAKA